jgi:alanine racemase
LPRAINLINNHDPKYFTGIWSHFGNAASPSGDDCHVQEMRFKHILDRLVDHKMLPEWIHLANTPGATRTSDKRINGIRLGGGLYGYDKSGITAGLRPVLRMTSTIQHILEVEKGQAVGYGRSYIAQTDQRLGIIPAGYHEGVLPRLSNRTVIGAKDRSGNVIFLPIRGKICMNYTIIDISDNSLSIGDPVTIISENPDHLNSIKQIADTTDVPAYEILLNINPNLPRSVE